MLLVSLSPPTPYQQQYQQQQHQHQQYQPPCPLYAAVPAVDHCPKRILQTGPTPQAILAISVAVSILLCHGIFTCCQSSCWNSWHSH
jgi:hypothetical protein